MVNEKASGRPKKRASTKKLFQSSEWQEQCTVFEWIERNSGAHPTLKRAFATLNGVRMTVGQAVKCKRAGMKKGVLDIFFLDPRGGYYGLIIELKIPGNDATPEQIIAIEEYNMDGFHAKVCVGADAVINVFKWYIKLPKTERVIP